MKGAAQVQHAAVWNALVMPVQWYIGYGAGQDPSSSQSHLEDPRAHISRWTSDPLG